MKKNSLFYLITVSALFLLSACGGENISSEGNVHENEKTLFEQLENPVIGYYAGIIYEGTISLDITEYREKQALEKGVSRISEQALIHVKTTNDLEITDLEGNELTLEELEIGDKVYLEIEDLERDDVTIETNILIVER